MPAQSLRYRPQAHPRIAERGLPSAQRVGHERLSRREIALTDPVNRDQLGISIERHECPLMPDARAVIGWGNLPLLLLNERRPSDVLGEFAASCTFVIALCHSMLSRVA